MLVLILQALAGLHVVGLVACVAMIQMDRFESIKRNLAIGMLVLFASGAGLIFLLEEIQPFIWESSAPAKAKKKKAAQGAMVGGGGGGGGGGDRDDGRDPPEESEEGGEAGDAVSSVKPKGLLHDCDKCPEMVPIAGGSFKMGAMPDEEGANASEMPQLDGVKIASFAIGRFEITREQYRFYLKHTNQQMRSKCDSEDASLGPATGDKPGFAVNGWHPVVCVTYNEAVNYTAWLSKVTGKTYRLPTAAEWEYAARHGNEYPFQNGTRKISPEEARFQPTSQTRGTTAVGSFGSTKRGLFDLHGNAAEWVQDCTTGTLKGASMTGQPAIAAGCQRMIKGGGWHSPIVDVRFAARLPGPATASNGVGFRVVREFD